ncbi:RICIN domain-containing protein [Halosimplex sp. TS25]|uniref:rhamnogalacturonan lyase family protein n=1 Tax=Halosimplex rarum TaxID=3396619 RepID=UPI0039EADF4A
MLAGLGNASAQSAPGPREAETLDRGVVAVQTDDGVLVRWRLLGTDPDGIGFNLYRDGQQVNDSPITGSTNYVDQNGSTGSTYTVAPVIDGTEEAESDPADVWQDNYTDIPLNSPGDNYSPNDCSVGDLTGDGSYDIVVKWSGTTKDNAQEGDTDPHIFDAYTLEGEHLWRIDLGINVRAGAHYAPFLVYDFDGDGNAEFVVRTADGTTDDAGTVIGDPDADWRNDAGRILEGPEYLTVFDGATGEEIVTTDYQPARGDVSDWGDDYGNRVDRFLAGVAYLDGEHPSIVMTRGYYEKTMLAAYDFRDGQLSTRWIFDSDDSGNGRYAGQGAHSLSVADVDDDGFDEIVYGACVIDHDGTGLHTTGWNHGDALHCSDFVPSRDGQEIFMPHEWGGMGATMRDAETGELLWNADVAQDTDVGRGVAGNIDSTHPGAEAWASNGIGLREGGSGDRISGAPGGSLNFVTWWTGDLQRELTDHDWQGDGIGYPWLGEWDPDAQQVNRLEDFPGTLSNNWTKGTPCLQADVLGDWREEVIWRRDDDQALRLFVTPFETNNRLYTLMHDTQYRTAVAWQNAGYNQPPHPSFFVGENMEDPPTPNIVTVGDGDTGDGDDDDDSGSTNPISTGTYQITNVNSGKALDAAGSSDGSNVQQYDYWGGENQQWYVEETSAGSYRIENVDSGKVLDVASQSTDDGANLQVYEDWEGDNQRWTIREDASGEYALEAVHSGKVADVDAASTDDGANVIQWSDNGGDNQRWTFESV